MMDSLTKQEELAATSNVYSLLGRLWLQELDGDLLAKLHSEPLKSAFQFDDSVQQSDLDSLAAEYCELFVGPKNHFPPMQSVWLEGKLDSEVTASVRAFADAVNYQPSSDYPNTLIDHLGIELEIMGSIVGVLANLAPEDPQLDETQSFASEFFGRHLCWTEKLTEAASAKAHSSFYKSLLANTREFLALELSRFVV